MSMVKNTDGQYFIYRAIDVTTGAGKTGDGGNHTVAVSKNGGIGASLTNSPSEIAYGFYSVELEADETNAETLLFYGTSSTANVVIDGAVVYPRVASDGVGDVVTEQVMAIPKGRAIELCVSLRSVATPGSIQKTPTIAAGDAVVSIDQGALTNLATLPSEAPTGSGLVRVNLSAAETTGDVIVVILEDQSGGQWLPQVLTLHTSDKLMDVQVFDEAGTLGSLKWAIQVAAAYAACTRRQVAGSTASERFEELTLPDGGTVLNRRKLWPNATAPSELRRDGTQIVRMLESSQIGSDVAVEGYAPFLGPMIDPSAGAVATEGEAPTLPYQIGAGAVASEGENPTVSWV